MEIIQILERMIWPGLAAIGFAILFNVPKRTLWVIYAMGAMCGLTKLTALHLGVDIVTASFLGAIVVGFLSIPAAHSKHSPMYVFAIPSVISMIPGAFTYRALLGLMRLTTTMDAATYTDTLQQTTSNGLKAIFILLSLAVGVALPMLITRRESAKEIVAGLKQDERN